MIAMFFLNNNDYLLRYNFHVSVFCRAEFVNFLVHRNYIRLAILILFVLIYMQHNLFYVSGKYSVRQVRPNVRWGAFHFFE